MFVLFFNLILLRNWLELIWKNIHLTLNEILNDISILLFFQMYCPHCYLVRWYLINKTQLKGNYIVSIKLKSFCRFISYISINFVKFVLFDLRWCIFFDWVQCSTQCFVVSFKTLKSLFILLSNKSISIIDL
jgi:hypothetical protein